MSAHVHRQAYHENKEKKLVLEEAACVVDLSFDLPKIPRSKNKNIYVWYETPDQCGEISPSILLHNKKHFYRVASYRGDLKQNTLMKQVDACQA